MSKPPSSTEPDAQLGSPPPEPELEAAEREERQTERQAPDNAEPGEASD